jgi:hypothetical protein
MLLDGRSVLRALHADGYEMVYSVEVDYDSGGDLRIKIKLYEGASTCVIMSRRELLLLSHEAALEVLQERMLKVLEPVKGRPGVWPQARAEDADVGEYVIGYRRWLVYVEEVMMGGAGPEAFGLSFEDIISGAERLVVKRYGLHPISTNIHTTEWDGGREVMARCVYHTHAAPFPHCGCGFNLWHDPAGIGLPTNTWDVLGGSEGVMGIVGGVVRARGRIEVHSDGFRAQYAQPLALLCEPDAPEAEVARALGLATVIYDDAEDFAQEHGHPVPVELRPSPFARTLGSSGLASSGARGLFQINTRGLLRATRDAQKAMERLGASMSKASAALSSYHYSGHAVDIALPVVNMNAALGYVRQRYGPWWDPPVPDPPRRNRRHGRPRGRMPH